MTDIECTSTGPVSGKVILFEWDIVGNELIPNLMTERIGYLKFFQKKNSLSRIPMSIPYREDVLGFWWHFVRSQFLRPNQIPLQM